MGARARAYKSVELQDAKPARAKGGARLGLGLNGRGRMPRAGRAPRQGEWGGLARGRGPLGGEMGPGEWVWEASPPSTRA